MRIIHLSYILLFILFTTACEKEDDNSTPTALDGLTKLNEGYASGASAKVEIWGKKNYFSGYNNLTVVVYDSLNPSEKISDAHIYFAPLMTMKMGMMSHTHACPVENPESSKTDGVFKGAIAFIMPTSESGDWELELIIHNHKNEKQGYAMFDITVDAPKEAMIKSFISESTVVDTFFVALVEPEMPKVGINDFELAVFSRNGAMDFPAVENLTISIEPEMPSMGHGSPNNENPVHVANGHYKGSVNFTMTGWWLVNLTIKDGDEILNDKLSFDITF